MPLSLVTPCHKLLPSFVEALREGDFVTMQLNFARASAQEIEAAPDAYLARVREAKPFVYPFRGKDYAITSHELLWLTDGARFLGTIALRYEGDQDLLMNWVGHIGMAIRPALLQKGYGARGAVLAQQAVKERFLKHGLKRIRASCNPENKPSRHLIEHIGGRLLRLDPDWALFEIDLGVGKDG